jgi:hypothetical protein
VATTQPNFKSRDVQRLVKALRSTGIEPTAVEVDRDGKIRALTSKGEVQSSTDLDQWKAKRDARKAQRNKQQAQEAR